MSGLPKEVRNLVDETIAASDLAFVGEYSVQEIGGSVYTAAPSVARSSFGIEKGDDVEVYVDFQNNAVVHVFGGGDA